MKLIKFAIDYRTDLNLPAMFGRKAMKRGDILYPKGTIMKLSDHKASYFVKKIIDWNLYEKTGKWKIRYLPAFVLKDLGCFHQKVCRENYSHQ